MALTETTLSAAVGATDNLVLLADATHTSAPTPTTGSTNTYLKIDEELMFVTGAAVNSYVPVNRGYSGTQAVSHLTSTPVLVGAPIDFTKFKHTVNNAFQALGEDSIGAPLTGATITPTGGMIHHFTGTTALTTIVPPNAVRAYRIYLVFDGSGSGLTWTAAGGANSIAVAGTVSQYQLVWFLYDPTTTLWYPGTIT